jgi:hypothetical protein
VPYKVAFGLNDGERLAYIVAFGTLSGRLFDWQNMWWKSELPD